ncbi:MAG: hypothetical protein KC503_37355 [Myxococcales bacterium]|nr:hypothetical protein [Myxococcales bacterium]
MNTERTIRISCSGAAERNADGDLAALLEPMRRLADQSGVADVSLEIEVGEGQHGKHSAVLCVDLEGGVSVLATCSAASLRQAAEAAIARGRRLVAEALMPSKPTRADLEGARAADRPSTGAVGLAVLVLLTVALLFAG